MRRKTNKKQKNKRNIFLKIRVTEEELEAFKRKYKNSRCKSFSDFVRRCVFDGLILLIDNEKMQRLYSMLNSINIMSIRSKSESRKTMTLTPMISRRSRNVFLRYEGSCFFSEAGSKGIDFKTICTGKIIILAAHFTRIITIIP